MKFKKKTNPNPKVFFNPKKRRLKEDVKTVFKYGKSYYREDRSSLFSMLMVACVLNE